MKDRGRAGSRTRKPPTPYSRSHHKYPVPSFIGRYHGSSTDEGGPPAPSLLSGVNRTDSANKRFSALECLLLGVKRKSISGDAMSAYSHKETFTACRVTPKFGTSMPVVGAVHRINSRLKSMGECLCLVRSALPKLPSKTGELPQNVRNLLLDFMDCFLNAGREQSFEVFPGSLHTLIDFSLHVRGRNIRKEIL